MKKLLTIITITLLFSSCKNLIDDKTTIKSVKKSINKGYYLYEIDAYPINQTLVSKEKYFIGDTIKLIKQ